MLIAAAEHAADGPRSFTGHFMRRLFTLAMTVLVTGCAINDPRPYTVGPFGIQIRDSTQEQERENLLMRD